MAQQPKRLSGEPNQKPEPVAARDWLTGANGHDDGIARALGAFLDRRKRRKELKTRES